METNTVLLELNEYNRLRDFEIGITKKGIALRDMYSNIYFVDESEAVKVFEREKDRLDEIILKLRVEYNEARKEEKPSKDLKQMSLWQLIKWWNKN